MTIKLDHENGYPFGKLVLLLGCRLAEPLAMASITPYAFFMVKDIAPSLSDAQATTFLTVLYSAYSFAQFATNLLWGHVSDRVGRRPVMLCGHAVVAVGTIAFGFSSSRAAMLLFRILPGLLSGNVVIVRTVVGEVVHTPEGQARAFAWNQTVFQAGYVLGPLIGGFLARPCHQFPQMCRVGDGTFLDRYPYALPNLVIGVIGVVSFFVAYFYVEESLQKAETEPSALAPGNEATETSVLLEAQETTRKVDPASFRKTMTPNVIHLVINYAVMALHTICFDQIFPVFLATPVAKSTLPFKMNGGMGLAADVVATAMSASGILSIALMVALYSPIDARFGSLRCLRLSLVLYPIAYFFIPYMTVIPTSSAWIQLSAVTVVLFVKVLAAVFSFNDSAVLLNTAAPSPNALGLVNGMAQTAGAATRALGPVFMGLFVELGERIDSSNLGWFYLATTAIFGVVQVFWIDDIASA